MQNPMSEVLGDQGAIMSFASNVPANKSSLRPATGAEVRNIGFLILPGSAKRDGIFES